MPAERAKCQVDPVSSTWKPGGRATVGAAIDGLRCSAMCPPLLGRFLPPPLPCVCLHIATMCKVGRR